MKGRCGKILKTTALLTGRGNNSLKDKNILKVLGKSLLYYPAHAARMAKSIDSWYCSSDDNKILEAAQEEGYTPIMRPPEYALPNAQHIDCILHALQFMKQNDDLSDILVVLLANNVSVKSQWIDDCVRIKKEHAETTAVVPVYEDNDHHPLRAKTINNDGFLELYEKDVPETISTNRQDLPRCYFLSHNFWVLDVPYLLSGKHGQQPWYFMGDKIFPYLIDESVDVHQKVDLLVAEEWVRKYYDDK